MLDARRRGMLASAPMPARFRLARAGLAAILAACADPGPALRITAETSGALTRTLRLAHPPDARHGCAELRVYGEPGSPGPLHRTAFEIRFIPDAADADSLLLVLDREAPSQVARIALTAGGRHWIGHTGLPGFTADIAAAGGLRSGRFAIGGLRPIEDGPERLALAGRWSCPPEGG